MRITKSSIKWNMRTERWDLHIETDDENVYDYSWGFKESAEAYLLKLIKRCGKGE